MLVSVRSTRHSFCPRWVRSRPAIPSTGLQLVRGKKGGGPIPTESRCGVSPKALHSSQSGSRSAAAISEMIVGFSDRSFPSQFSGIANS